MFFVANDLSEAQRERLTSSLYIRRVEVTAFTFESVRTVFVELFCTPKFYGESLTPNEQTRHFMRVQLPSEDFDEDDLGQ